MNGKPKKMIIFLAITIFLGYVFLFFAKKEKKVEINFTREEEIISDKISDANEKEKPTEKSEKPREEENKLPKITKKLVNWGLQPSSGRKIDSIIIHTSYNILTYDPYDFDKLLEEYKTYEVAPHYLINRKGEIFQLVLEENIAYHAGKSQVPDGRKGVNDFSIGIELMNTKKDEITKSQYDSLGNLLAYLKSKYEIKYVLGHSDIAAGRKDDPWNFNWKKVK